jgi:Protein of unknown function (DUF3110)
MAHQVRVAHQLKNFLTISIISSLCVLSGLSSSIAQSTSVYVLLYNAKSNNEGIYSIKNGKVDTILVFSSESAAKRYASQLKLVKIPRPTIEAMSTDEILKFCRIQNYICGFIPQGIELSPPTDSLTPSQRDYQP